MNKQEIPHKKSRFDVRLSPEQKAYLERAARAGSYRNLTDFILNAAQEKAEEIITKKEQVIASEGDKITFFEEVTMPQEPNRSLIDATKEYEHLFLK